LGAAGEPDSAGASHAISEAPNEAHKGRRADTARFAAETDSMRNSH